MITAPVTSHIHQSINHSSQPVPTANTAQQNGNKQQKNKNKPPDYARRDGVHYVIFYVK